MIPNPLTGGPQPEMASATAVDAPTEQPNLPAAAGAPSGNSKLADAGIAMDDWDTLLSAVKARLRLTAAVMNLHQFNGATTPLQACVLECVDALDQLHASLRTSLGRTSIEADPGTASRERGDVPPVPISARANGPAWPVQL